MGRRRKTILAAAVVVGLIALGVAAVGSFEDSSDSVSPEEAARRLQLPASEAPRVNGAPVPASGVYEYATRGQESFDAFISATHAYPDVTTIAVVRGGCGVLMRWTPLEQRQTEYELCPGRRRWEMAGYSETHEFFGQGDERRYECPGAVAFKRSGRWAYTCTYADRVDRFQGEVVGVEGVRVAGERIPAVHTRETDALSGEEEGSGRVDTWWRRSDGLILRRVATTRDRAPVPVGGSGVYSESYELELVSPTPLR